VRRAGEGVLEDVSSSQECLRATSTFGGVKKEDGMDDWKKERAKEDTLQWIEPGDAERERLYLLIEEASEVIQIASKVLRFGYNQTRPDEDLSNRGRLAIEVGDLLFVIEMLLQGDLQFEMVNYARDAKGEKVRAYTKYEHPTVF
jgi:NTP pyrophosphatase (non-canonical NTP hydrolase)